MAVDQKVSIFTTALRKEFVNAYFATANPAPWENYTTIVPSTARIEHYTWMTPSPGLAQYAGHRRYANIDAVKYSVENLEFDAAFQVRLRDIEDDQTGGYMLKPKELAERAKKFPGRWVLKHLSQGKTYTCFDGTAMFANSHTLGSGRNLLTYDGSANDGLTFKLVALYHGGPLKPLLYQRRKEPDFQTNAGSVESKENKEVRYWIDMEGAAGFGYWWDAIWVDITDTPTVSEIHTILGNIKTAFMTFQLPKALTSEDGEYVHEQTEFSSANLTLVGSPGLDNLMRQVLNQDWVPQNVGSNTVATTNYWKGFANWVPSAFLA
jgi:phage major head subunit gpT-like protein